MAKDIAKFQRSILACLANAKRLLEEAQWWTNQASTGSALALLAQEECAKAFVLVLARDGVLPWTEEVRRSLSVHECKHLVTMIMEWLSAVNELRLDEIHAQASQAEAHVHLPRDVAIAMNIYRHEMIERIGKRDPAHYSDWGGVARKVAKGRRDRMKQRALYVGISEDGEVESEPSISPETAKEELARTEKLLEFAEDADRKCILAWREYELFAETFKTMFKDLAEPQYGAQQEEMFPSSIPGCRTREENHYGRGCRT